MEKNTYRLLNIILIESSFKRASNIDFSNKELKNNIDIDINNNVNKNLLIVTVSLNFNTTINSETIISSEIKMAGSFEFSEDNSIPLESFGNINAPAIIFPFIREHLSGLSMKAGIQPILLPPVNFVELAKKEK
ncbi:protein-export chaperone SecB [Flammeovirga sp. EKP202]|uniref:protein-export chaperone SecB n=1 Tax=Flammeovirga sp. EKP202 TaxID=2770592 RepID=UPI00165ECD3A|nr:protein-export chaperone SecB [Flammeovirga sp. EKP202]MBD0403202.1 protein-export chaperone SecB [Flammeovirga sp. EKP202]